MDICAVFIHRYELTHYDWLYKKKIVLSLLFMLHK